MSCRSSIGDIDFMRLVSPSFSQGFVNMLLPLIGRKTITSPSFPMPDENTTAESATLDQGQFRGLCPTSGAAMCLVDDGMWGENAPLYFASLMDSGDPSAQDHQLLRRSCTNHRGRAPSATCL